MHKQTVTVTNADTKTHTCTLTNYFRSQLQGEAADLEQHNMKDYSLPRYCAQATKPLFILFSAPDILKRLRTLPGIFREGVKLAVIKSKINDKISVLLPVKS